MFSFAFRGPHVQVQIHQIQNMDSIDSGAVVPKPKRQRKANWRQDACLRLLQLIDENRNIIEVKKFNSEVTAKMRRDTWEDVTRKLNASFPESVRTKSDIEKKWWALKAQGREELCNHRKSLAATGKKPYFYPLSAIQLITEIPRLVKLAHVKQGLVEKLLV